MEGGNKTRPANTLFKQQRLPAWQPILSPPHVSACFVVIAAIFIPIGVAIINANSRVGDIEFRYDDVTKCTYQNNQKIAYFPRSLTNATDVEGQGCRTLVRFKIPEKMDPPVYMYYKLTNFYQNHRRFAKSRSDKQLTGADVGKTDMADCDPLLTPGDTAGSGATPMTINGQATSYGALKYAPCGLVAWSMFNDTFRLYRENSSSTTGRTLICDGGHFSRFDSAPLPAGGGEGHGQCHKSGIAWDSDKEAKFKIPSLNDGVWSAQRSIYLGNLTGRTLTPEENRTYFPTTNDAYFAYGFYANETGHSVPVTTDEDLMVWMRTASLPSFRKLYRIIDTELPAGDYVVEIDEFYDVSSFEGEKLFALATVSWAGGKNDFLGIAYVVVGACALLAGAAFFITHKLFGDRSQKAIEELMETMK